MSDYEAPVDKWPRFHSREHSSTYAYCVEARVATHHAKVINGQAFDLRWSRIDTFKTPIGVPQANPYEYETIKEGLFSYEAAQALRFWFIATAKLEHNDICLETRLVKFQLEVTRECEAIEAIEARDWRGPIKPKEVKPCEPVEASK